MLTVATLQVARPRCPSLRPASGANLFRRRRLCRKMPPKRAGFSTANFLAATTRFLLLQRELLLLMVLRVHWTVLLTEVAPVHKLEEMYPIQRDQHLGSCLRVIQAAAAAWVA